MKDDEKKGGCAFGDTLSMQAFRTRKEELLKKWGDVGPPPPTAEQREEWIRLVREQSTFFANKPAVYYFDSWWVRLYQRVRDLLSRGSR